MAHIEGPKAVLDAIRQAIGNRENHGVRPLQSRLSNGRGHENHDVYAWVFRVPGPTRPAFSSSTAR